MLDPTDLRTLAWKTLPCRYKPCSQPAGRRCITASGERTTPHAVRISDIAMWQQGFDSRDPEVAALITERGDLRTEVQRLNAEITGQAEALATMERDLAVTVSERDHWKGEYERTEADRHEQIHQLIAARNQLDVALHDLDAATDQNGVLTDQVRDSQRALFIAQDELAKARARIAELEAGEPEPEPERLPFGIGTVEKAASGSFPMLSNVAALEQAAGVKFTYMHEYFTFPSTGVATSLVAWCETQLKAGRIPVPTAKLPSGDWVGGAAGKYDGTLKATADALEALAVKYGSRVILGVQHEPDNDGKTLASWKALLDHIGPIVRRPGLVEFWANYTGWAQLYGDSGDWLIADLPTDQVDGVAFNPYLSLGASSTKLTSMRTAYLEKFAAWAKARGIQWGIWETGINEVAAANTTFAAVKTWITDTADDAAELGATMWFYWNNRVDADHPDWRISKTLPANKHGQIVAAMQKYAPTKEN